jgi:hypothetical protein
MLVLGAGAIGCGSSGDGGGGETSVGGDAPITTTGTEKEAPKAATEAASQTANGEHSSSPSESRQSKNSSGKQGGSSPAAPPPQTADSTPGHRQALGHKAAQDCPAGLSAAQCGALVEAYAAARAKGADATEINDPKDCLKVMSRENCEAMLSAQKAAAEAAGTPVNVDECMQNMTPRCEEVLRPMFEAQRGN